MNTMPTVEMPTPAAGSALAAPARHSDRRERKKRQTREALVQAALELFEAQGYEQTTVKEITDAVDVATRTFFRYFASKEDLVVSFSQDFSARFAGELAVVPAEQEPLLALRNAFAAALLASTDDDAGPGRESAYSMIVKLVENTPPLLAAYLRDIHDRQDETVRALAEREGVDPVADLRPRIAASVFTTMVATATKLWMTEGDTGAREILRHLDASLAHLHPALAGHWSTQAAGEPAR